MTTTVEPEVKWSQDQMVEVTLNEPDDFLKVRETLTRIGVASRKEKKLYQSCHILHKKVDIILFILKNYSLLMENMLISHLMMFSDVTALLAFLLIGALFRS